MDQGNINIWGLWLPSLVFPLAEAKHSLCVLGIKLNINLNSFNGFKTACGLWGKALVKAEWWHAGSETT